VSALLARATTILPTLSFTHLEPWVALPAGRAVGAAQAPDNALARVGHRTSHGHRERAAGGAVRAPDWDREPLFPIAKRRMEMPFDRAGWISRLTRKSCRQSLAV
jgi:hypothetical protein